MKESKKSCLFMLIMASLLLVMQPQKSLARGFTFQKGKVNSIIPFEYIDGLIVLPFKIGNKEVKLILDTGIKNIVLFSRIGSYGLETVPNKYILFSGIGRGSIIKGKYVTEVNVKSDNIEGSGLTIIIIPQSPLSRKLDMGVHGFIGYDLFSRFLVTIDYTKNQLILSHPKDFIHLDIYQEKQLILIDTKPYLSFNFSIPGVEDKDQYFLIDTGAGFDLLLNLNPYSIQRKKRYDFLGSGLTGDVKGKSYMLNQVHFDNFYFDNFLVYVPSSGTYTDKELMKDRDGTLGGKFLHKFEKVVLDYSNKKIYFVAQL